MEKDRLKTQENLKVPLSFKKYFWDCNIHEITWASFPFFIAERIMQYGNNESIEWLLNVIEIDFLEFVLKNSRNLDKKTLNFWKNILQ